MKATAEIQAIPIAPVVSVRREVHGGHELLKESGLIIETHASGTNVEGDLSQILQVGGTRPRGPSTRRGQFGVTDRREARDANRRSAPPSRAAPSDGGSPGGPTTRAARPLRPRRRVAARRRGSRPRRCLRACPAPARGSRRGARSPRRRDSGPLPWGGGTPERHPPRPASAWYCPRSGLSRSAIVACAAAPPRGRPGGRGIRTA